MSNRKKAPDAVRRAAQHRQGRGRHREPMRSPGDLVAVPGQAGLKILAAGALGSAALMSLPGAASAASASGPVAASLTASVRPAAPAAGAPAPISGGTATIGVTNGQPSLGFTLKTPFGTTPQLTLPTVTPFQPVQLQFDKNAAIAAVANDPAYQNLAQSVLYQSVNQQVNNSLAQLNTISSYLSGSSQAPSSQAPSFGPGTPVDLYGLPVNGSGLLPSSLSGIPAGTSSSGQSLQPFGVNAQPVLYTNGLGPSATPAVSATGTTSADSAPPAAPTPPLSLSGSISGAAGLGGTLGLACDNGGNCALTVGPLVGVGGSARLAVSPNPAPTGFSVDANAQASGNILGYGVTGGVSGSLTNFTGLQVFGRVTTPDANQVTVSGTIPPSTLANMGKAISDAAAIKAGLPVDQQAGPPTPNQQVAQDFADLAGGSGGGISAALGGRLVSFGSQTTAGLTATIPFNLKTLADMGNAYLAAEAGMTVDQMLGTPTPAPSAGSTLINGDFQALAQQQALVANGGISPGLTGPTTYDANGTPTGGLGLLTYQPPTGQFPAAAPSAAERIDSAFAQMQTAPDLVTQIAQEAQQGGQAGPGQASQIDQAFQGPPGRRRAGAVQHHRRAVQHVRPAHVRPAAGVGLPARACSRLRQPDRVAGHARAGVLRHPDGPEPDRLGCGADPARPGPAGERRRGQRPDRLRRRGRAAGLSHGSVSGFAGGPARCGGPAEFRGEPGPAHRGRVGGSHRGRRQRYRGRRGRLRRRRRGRRLRRRLHGGGYGGGGSGSA